MPTIRLSVDSGILKAMCASAFCVAVVLARPSEITPKIRTLSLA